MILMDKPDESSKTNGEGKKETASVTAAPPSLSMSSPMFERKERPKSTELSSDGPNDRSAAATPAVTPRGTEVNTKSSAKPSSYGQPKHVLSVGTFGQPGSMLGPFFCLGKLGKGTFCSIHKCISLQGEPRLVAAKLELNDFVNSGVLEGEATMLQHLDNSLPPRTVPKYMGLYKSDEASAIVMEYLPGEDMHCLRERGGRRRVSLKDAVYLTADVMLPLLQKMHKAGVVHRDVKPSNCVRYTGNQFAMVDFGLSKSILTSRESQHADTNHVWPGSDGQQCLRKERETADFRGTSMYASLKVHESRDYSRRDDIWSLLYVFCDLVSGGLPWMSYAATRDRETCRKLKHDIFTNGATDQMLMGEDYHVSKFKRDMAEQKGTSLPPLAEPLALSKDANKVKLLDDAFKHVGSLAFADEPDYDFVRKCLHGFLDEPIPEDSSIPDIEWDEPDKKEKKRKQKWKQDVPTWELQDSSTQEVAEDLWLEAEAERQQHPVAPLYPNAVDFSRLPVEWQFRIAQMEYSVRHPERVKPHVALRDFMQCALPLVYSEWDTPMYEPGNRTNKDSYRREVYYKLINKCLNASQRIKAMGLGTCFYDKDNSSVPAKRRKITSSEDDSKFAIGNDLVAVSRVLFALEDARKEESRKGPAPLSHVM